MKFIARQVTFSGCIPHLMTLVRSVSCLRSLLLSPWMVGSSSFSSLLIISLSCTAATVSEYQRFLSRICSHKTLRTEHPFVTFLTGSAEVRRRRRRRRGEGDGVMLYYIVQELRTMRAKFRPRDTSEHGVQYRPAQGRDTSGGALVSTKHYLVRLETSIAGLVSQLQQQAGNRDHGERMKVNTIKQPLPSPPPSSSSSSSCSSRVSCWLVPGN